MFDQAGNRDNKLRARLKWLIDTLGFDEVQRRILKVRHLLPASSSWPGGIPPEVAEHGDAPAGRHHRRRGHAGRPRRSSRRRRSASAGSRPTCAGTRPTSCAASPTARCRPTPGRRSATSPPTSSGRWLRSSASSGASVRLTNRQNVVFRDLTDEQLPVLFERLEAIGMAQPGAELVARRRRLPGRRHLQPRRHAEPWARQGDRRPARGRGPGRGRRRAHQHLGLHQLVRSAPRLRHRLLRRRAPRQRAFRSRLPDAARRLRRPGADLLRREGAAPAGQERRRGRGAA